jgi:hypothetical protein
MDCLCLGGLLVYISAPLFHFKNIAGKQTPAEMIFQENFVFQKTCSLQSRPLFPTLVDALRHYFNGTQPDLSWIKA